ncbi:hypothetical protein Q3G72_022381 [Acer saccharum]|nr:hypothetical protein Q3G72_022381 [Acer saccharum]
MGQQENSPTPLNGHERSHCDDDEETVAALQSKELRRKKNIKCAIKITIFIASQIVSNVVMALTIMKFRNPKLMFGTITVKNMVTNTISSSPSFNMKFFAQVRVKNTNFGPYKFENTTVIFTYEGVLVGWGLVPETKVNFRSTKKMNVFVEVNSNNGLLLNNSSSSLGSELNANVLTLHIQARLRGKVELMFVLKKRKYAEMKCTIKFNTSTKTVQDLKCK